MDNINPLLGKNSLPKFQSIKSEHVYPAAQALVKEVLEKFEQIEKGTKKTWESIFEPLEDINQYIEKVWGPVAHLTGVQNSSELRSAYEKSLPLLVDLNLRMEQSRILYKSALEIREDKKYWLTLVPAQKRIIAARILNAEVSGVSLEGEKKERFNTIARELSELTTAFSNNVLDATKAFSLVLKNRAEVQGLPEPVLAFAAQNFNSTKSEGDSVASSERGPWRITLDGPSFLPFMEFSERRDLRLKLFNAMICKAGAAPFDNSEKIQSILRLRLEQAQLLGYKNYAELSLVQKMAGTPKAVYTLLEDLLAKSRPAAEKEFLELQQFAKKDGFEEKLAHWDIAFWARTMRESLFNFTEEELRPYFPMPVVLDGFFNLLNKLFEVTVHKATETVEVWDMSVDFYEIRGVSGQVIAGFFLDPYSRPQNKRGGAWMDVCRSLKVDRQTAGCLEYPIAYLVCNGTPPVGEKPSLMDFNEVRTLFHEFGHGLQHMLTTVPYAGAAGISGVEWDAVELPSQFMENWLYHEKTLLSLTKHIETGEKLPHHYVAKIMAAKNYRAGNAMLRQLQFALMDMDLYSKFDPNGSVSPFAVQAEAEKRASVLGFIPGNKMLCSFSHIFAGGYSAGYYSYKWAEVLSADAFEAFIEAGTNSDDVLRKTGKLFRDTILAMGGSLHPMEVFKKFRGREPQTDALLKSYGM